jgi:hypothetical protein
MLPPFHWPVFTGVGRWHLYFWQSGEFGNGVVMAFRHNKDAAPRVWHSCRGDWSALNARFSCV